MIVQFKFLAASATVPQPNFSIELDYQAQSKVSSKTGTRINDDLSGACQGAGKLRRNCKSDVLQSNTSERILCANSAFIDVKVLCTIHADPSENEMKERLPAGDFPRWN